MWQLSANIYAIFSAIQKIEIVFKRLPFAPRHAFIKRGAGNVFHALHKFDQGLSAAGPYWRKTHAAIAHNNARNAVV